MNKNICDGYNTLLGGLIVLEILIGISKEIRKLSTDFEIHIPYCCEISHSSKILRSGFIV